MDNPFEKIDERLSNIEMLLFEIKNQIQNTSPEQDLPEEIINVDQASKFLRLTKATIYSKVSRSELPVMKRGGRLYFSRNDLIDYIKLGRKKTYDEISKEADEYLIRRSHK